MRKILICTAVMAALLAFSACRSDEANPTNPVSRNHFALNTVSRITIYDKDQGKAEEILKAVFARIDEIESAMSLFNDQSETSLINRQAGISAVEVSQDTFKLLSLALDIASKSAGAFDPTVGPLVQAWGITSDNPRIPGEEEMEALLELVDYRNIILKDSNQVLLSRRGMILDLGAIAKGYAADEAKRIIEEMGSSSALINLGGNILLAGSKPDRTPWRIGVQDPGSSRGMYTIILILEGGTVVTSGTYERFFFENGIKYHHILDTSTGYPADNSLESVTIIAENSAYADGLSTAAFVMGLEKGMEFIESLEDAEAVFITRDKSVHLTSGFSSEHLGWSLSDQSYQVIEAFR